MKRLLTFIVLFTVALTIAYIAFPPDMMRPYMLERIDRAVSYLKSHFNENLGLIYESEACESA